MRTLAFLATVVLLQLGSSVGCATIMSGKTQPLTFNSMPEGADVYVNGMKVGTTPLTAEVRRKEGTVITLKKEGYEDTTLQPREKTNTWLIGNLIFSWLSTTGTTVDYVNDTNIEYTPEQFFTTLKPVQVSYLDSFYRKLRIARFTLHRYQQLAAEIACGSGENLSSLLALLDVDEGGKTAVVKELQMMFAENEGPPNFTHAVLDGFTHSS